MFTQPMFKDTMMKYWNEKFDRSCEQNITGFKIKGLIKQLSSQDEVAYLYAGRRLILFGAQAVDYLIDALEDERIWIPASVLLDQIVAQLDEIEEKIDDESVDKLIEMALEKKSNPVGEWIIRFLKKADTPRAHKGLHDLLGVDDDNYVTTTILLEILGKELAAGKYRL